MLSDFQPIDLIGFLPNNQVKPWFVDDECENNFYFSSIQQSFDLDFDLYPIRSMFQDEILHQKEDSDYFYTDYIDYIKPEYQVGDKVFDQISSTNENLALCEAITVNKYTKYIVDKTTYSYTIKINFPKHLSKIYLINDKQSQSEHKTDKKIVIHAFMKDGKTRCAVCVKQLLLPFSDIKNIARLAKRCAKKGIINYNKSYLYTDTGLKLALQSLCKIQPVKKNNNFKSFIEAYIEFLECEVLSVLNKYSW